MNNPPNIDDLASKLSGLLPPGATHLRAELERNFRELLRAQLNKLDLVTREEFEVQSAVLAKSRARLEQLETRLAELENVTSRPE